jgi:putative flippase GtrA
MGRWQTWLETARRFADEHQTKVRFVIAGAFNTALGLVAYPTLYFVLAPMALHYLTIMVISQALCINFAFMTNKYLVFRTVGNHLSEYGKFITFHLGYFLLNLVVLPVLVEFALMNPVWAQMLFTVLVIVSGYFWQSRITFASAKSSR